MNTLESMADIQGGLDRLLEWGDKNPSTRTDAEPTVWEGRAPCSATDWGKLGWGVALLEGTRDTAKRKARSLPWQQRRTTAS